MTCCIGAVAGFGTSVSFGASSLMLVLHSTLSKCEHLSSCLSQRVFCLRLSRFFFHSRSLSVIDLSANFGSGILLQGPHKQSRP
jgi:hypothetical protein